MPKGNIGGPFKSKSAKDLADSWDLTPAAFSFLEKRIMLHDVQWLVDEINYSLHNEYIFKKNEKRYDTDWKPYTKKEFMIFYGEKSEDYFIHWISAPIAIRADYSEPPLRSPAPPVPPPPTPTPISYSNS